MWAIERRVALDLTLLVLFLYEFLSLSLAQPSKEVWQWITLYTGEGGSGEPLAIMEQEFEDLESLGFGNGKAKAECHIGAWIIIDSLLSEEPKYVRYLRASGCSNVKFGSKSVRFAGDPSNYTRDSLTVFETPIYGKNKEVFYTDVNVKMRLVNSMAATGSSDWTVYKDPDYAGASHCIKFTYVDYKHFVILLYNRGTPNTIDVSQDWISSVRKGCHSSSIWTI